MFDSPRPASRATAAAFATAVAATCAAIAVIVARDPAFESLLEYQRAAVATGSLHRLVTAHLVHLSTAHAVLDITGLALVGWIFAGELTARRLLLVTLAATAAVDAGLWFWHPEVDRYAGLSGVLHGWFAAGAAGWALADRGTHAFVAKRVWGAVLLSGLVVKLAVEQRGYTFWLDANPMRVVTAAHRWGAAAGALCVLIGCALQFVFRRRRGRADGA